MGLNGIIKTESLLSILGAIGLLIWWFSIPVFLPIADSKENFEQLILHYYWLPINSIGLCSALLLTLGFPGFYLKNAMKLDKLGIWGLILASIGLILFTSIQYYETILWPAAAKVNPELLKVDGALVSGDSGVLIGLISSGAFLSIGYVLFAASALKAKAYPKLPLYLLTIGVPLFGLGVIYSIRTIGLLLFCAGTIYLGRNILKEVKLMKQ